MCGINVDEIRASDKGVLGWLIFVMDALLQCLVRLV
jgi:hypothetical protein